MSAFSSVQITPRATAQLHRADRWWRQHRLAAPDAVLEDFEVARELLAHQPQVGARCSSPHHAHLRRLHLSRIRYHVYYRVEAKHVVILAIWHASRGSAPWV